MTELEKIKSEITQLANRVLQAETKSNEDVFIFNREQLLEYTKKIIEHNIHEVKTSIRGIRFTDDIVDLELDGGSGYRGGYSIRISIDDDGIQHCIIDEISDLGTDEEAIGSVMIDVLGSIGYFATDENSVGH
jgi:hypothetical protein